MPEDGSAPARIDPSLTALLANGVAEDWVDRRDRFFVPPLSILARKMAPDARAFPPAPKRGKDPPVFTVRHQGQSGRCVGYALAALIDIQRRIRGDDDPGEIVSADMLYTMARFHDRYTARPDGRKDLAKPDPDPEREGVRTLRSVIKAFYHHGACLDFPGEGVPPPCCWQSESFGSCSEGQTLLTAAQACAARELNLGAYYRLRPVLHDYHAALHEAGAVLVSARVGAAWQRPEGGRIRWSSDAPAGAGQHAFVLVGYDEKGFLVLNSWGAAWGGFGGWDDHPFPALPGIAHWKYEDWGANVVDAWVLRLGVPAPAAFEMSIGEHGPSRVYGPTRAGSVPCHELMGHYLHLDDGRHVEIDNYPSEEKLADALLTGVGETLAEDSRGVALWLPGSLEPMKQGFELAVARKAWLEGLRLYPVTIFWCNDFAQHVMRVVREVIGACEAEAGAGAAHLDAMIEARAHGLGRALWRDIEGSARRSVRGRGRGEGPALTVFRGLIEHCQTLGKELHVVAEGAGALVLDALLQREPWADEEGRAALASRITSLSLSLPAIPLARKEVGEPKDCLSAPSARDLLDLMARMNAGVPAPVVVPEGSQTDGKNGDRSPEPKPDVELGPGLRPAVRAAAEMVPPARPRPPARVYVPDADLEARIRFEGYGRSVLHLVSTSFMGTFDVRRRATQPTLLGMARARTERPGRPEFRTVGVDPALPPGPIEQIALSLHPDLEAEMLAAIRDHTPAER